MNERERKSINHQFPEIGPGTFGEGLCGGNDDILKGLRLKFMSKKFF
jgi:hypothetical protein